MSKWLITDSDLSLKPRLLTFAYGKQAQGAFRRSWSEIVRLGKLNLIFILMWNVCVWLVITIGLLAVTYVLITDKDHSDWLQLFLLLWIPYVRALIGMIPAIIALANLLLGRGYTVAYEHEQFRAMVLSAKAAKAAQKAGLSK